MQQFKNFFLFHKEGFKCLKLIHKADSSAIPLSLLSALINTCFPYIELFLSARIIDTLITKDYTQCITVAVIMILLNYVFGVISDGLSAGCKTKQEKIDYLVQAEIRRKALSLDYETLESPSTLELLNTADFSIKHNGGYNVILQCYTELITAIISIIASLTLVFSLCFTSGGLSSGGIIGFIAYTPVSLFLISTIIILIALLNIKVSKFYNDKSLKLFDMNIQIEHEAAYFFNEVIGDYSKGKVMRIYHMEEMILSEIKKFNKEVIKNFKKFLASFQNQQCINTVIPSILNGLAYIFVILKVISKAITIGSTTKYVGAISLLSNSFIKLIKYNDEIRVKCKYFNYINQFMELNNKRFTGTIPIEKRTDNNYELEFHNVSFSYPGSENYILKNINCKINLKEKLAIVGRNGAGKTTFIKLLCRLYDPTEGVITLNGIDIKKYNYEEYLSLFSVVFQDFSLFAFPMGENISSCMTYDEEKVWKCLELSGIKNRVAAMPLKLQTPLFKYDDGGIEISGGEAQKLAMARALYKDAPFVILDEPTAALDPVSEYEIYSNFNNMVDNKTSIFISHRMSSCRFCNDIIVFNNGCIIQRGSHEKLLQDTSNVYSDLWEAQAKYYI